MDSIAMKRSGWNGLSLEIRQMIWVFVYATQDGRVVEVNTAEHDHYTQDHEWCPRISPNPRPKMYNICHEARNIAYEVARDAGHLIFQTPESTGIPEIHFNPEIDTLFVRNNKDYWIRDWGSEGILTQMLKMHHSEPLRFLAIELDPLTRATTHWSIHVDLIHFSEIEEITFVVKEHSKQAQELVRILERTRQGLIRDGGFLAPVHPRNRPKVSARLRRFRLAMLRRGRLEILEFPTETLRPYP